MTIVSLLSILAYFRRINHFSYALKLSKKQMISDILSHCVKSNRTVFGVFLVGIFPHSDWIRRDTVSLRIQSHCGKIRTRIPYSVRMWENMDQKKLRIRTLFTQKGYIVLKWVNQVLRVVLMPFASFAARQMFVQN